MCAPKGVRTLAPCVHVRTVDRVRMSLVEIALFATAAALLLAAVPRCGGGRSQAVVRASWRLTPGVLNPDVSQGTIRATICTAGWTRTVRPPVSYTNDLKRRQLRADTARARGCAGRSGCRRPDRERPQPPRLHRV